jgi:hypothetical protein
MPGTLKSVGAIAVLVLAAACSGAPANTTGPTIAGSSPGATTQTTQAATVAPTTAPTPPPVGGGSECAPFATMNPASFALPSFAPDPQIVAIFPSEIDGEPVTDLQTVRWLESICFYSGQAGVDRTKANGGSGTLLANLTYGFAHATVGGDSVTISAYRVAGQDGNVVIQNLALFVSGLTGQTPEPFTTSQTNLGGKAAYAITGSDGEVSYAYVIGDVVVSVSDVDETQAATIFAAFP